MNARFGWMGLGVCILLLAIIARAENEAKFYPNGKLYIPKVQWLDKEGSVLQTYQVTMKKQRGEWMFKLSGLSPAEKPVDVTGTWTFNFETSVIYSYTNSTWSWTNSADPKSYSAILTQNTDYTVSGAIAANMWLDGLVAGEDFYFVILVGSTDSIMQLVSCQCMVESNSMDGVFYFNYTNGLNLGAGNFTATR